MDDKAQFRATTKKILDRRGFDTYLAESGEEAIEKLSSEPDVLVLDIGMPGMDGHETLMEIRKRKPDVPVIMLTGHGDMPSAKDALKQGAFDYPSKPRDIDILSAKILEAHRTMGRSEPAAENTAGEIMIPIEEYTTLNEQHTIREAIETIRASFYPRVATSRIMETGHGSVLVIDPENRVKGVVAIIDLLGNIMPAYLTAPKPSMADSVQYSTMFWTGEFTRSVKSLANKKLSEIMSPPPPTIDYDANLMEVAYAMFSNKERRLVVMKKDFVCRVHSGFLACTGIFPERGFSSHGKTFDEHAFWQARNERPQSVPDHHVPNHHVPNHYIYSVQKKYSGEIGMPCQNFFLEFYSF